MYEVRPGTVSFRGRSPFSWACLTRANKYLPVGFDIAASAGRGVSLLSAVIGLAILYGSYLIYRGKTSLLFGWGKTRLGAWINLILGFVTLIAPGGVGGTPSILAIVSGILGLLAA